MRSLLVAKSIALKCGDTPSADRFHREWQSLSQSNRMMDGVNVTPGLAAPNAPIIPVPSTSHELVAPSPSRRYASITGRYTINSACTPNTALCGVLSPEVLVHVRRLGEGRARGIAKTENGIKRDDGNRSRLRFGRVARLLRKDYSARR
jgi:hypothetical protein